MEQHNFTWVTFYNEFANKLLSYKSDRKSLLDFINTIDKKHIGYLHEEDGRPLGDICPFTVIGIFNRGNTFENRKNIAEKFKIFLDITSLVPDKFDGIPVLNNQKSYFFGFSDRRKPNDINNLWELFEKAQQRPYDIEDIFNVVITQFCINVNITMGLYWILPDKFIALDSLNRNYLKQYNIHTKATIPPFQQYIELIQSINKKMEIGEIKEKSFPEFSYRAWMNTQNKNNKNMMDSNHEYWDEKVKLLRFKKNIILKGAPGTGKTYNVPEIAVRLCYDININPDRNAIMEEYKKLLADGRIVFTTFHQSMDYEEFIEGLKPELIDDAINYTIVDGLFKQLCKRAQIPVVANNHLDINENPSIWKVSLMATYDNPVRTDCLENNRIRIGWDGYGAVISEDNDYEDGGKTVLDAFINKMQIGDIVMSCYSNRIVDAIGIVEGEYEWNDNFNEYKRVRSVKWLVKNIREDIYELNNKTAMTLSTVYRLNNMSLVKVMNILEKYKVINRNTVYKNENPYIVVIDEINRGNVSKIFGELITLLEEDKRLGKRNEITVTLPYSKERFGIPSNVYLIGTMNTADRSIGNIDYAIRRRFAFVDTIPYSLDIDGFDEELFKQVSELFIESYKDYSENGIIKSSKYLSEEFCVEDVWIGHSYFIMKDENGNDVTELRLHFEIIPILKEYIKDGIFKDKIAVEKRIEEIVNVID